MALKSITFESFKNRLKGSYEFGATNRITGRNGAGKSTIRDLIAFGFCGTDSRGVRNPTHLISKGQESLKVLIETDRAKISRTLTMKGSSTIKVEVNGVNTTYTQTQLEGMVGSVDVFLSAFVPGYFFELTNAKRQQVIADITPKVDRASILKELCGQELTAEEKLKYGINRRADLVASAVSQDRRAMDSTLDQKTGRIAQLTELKEPVRPTSEDVSALIEASTNNATLWAKYENLMQRYNNIKASIDNIQKENQYRALRSVEVQAQLDAIVLTKPIKPDVVLEELVLQPEPSMTFKDLSDAESCATCGQPVSPRYREQVAKNNAEIKAKFDSELTAVKEANRIARETYSAKFKAKQESDKAYLEAVESNRKLEARRKALELELAGLFEVACAILPELPVAPEEVFSKDDHLALIEKQKIHDREWAVYNSQKADFDTCAEQIHKLQGEFLVINEARNRLVAIEAGLKRLPEAEIAMQIGRFNTETMVFDGDTVFISGIPHHMLSTGEQLRIFWIFCKEITDMMPKPHRMIFVDNYELLTHTDTAWDKFTNKTYGMNNYQMFYSSCADCEFTITKE